jgi:hypothetical protein
LDAKRDFKIPIPICTRETAVGAALEYISIATNVGCIVYAYGRIFIDTAKNEQKLIQDRAPAYGTPAFDSWCLTFHGKVFDYQSIVNLVVTFAASMGSWG